MFGDLCPLTKMNKLEYSVFTCVNLNVAFGHYFSHVWLSFIPRDKSEAFYKIAEQIFRVGLFSV